MCVEWNEGKGASKYSPVSSPWGLRCRRRSPSPGRPGSRSRSSGQRCSSRCQNILEKNTGCNKFLCARSMLFTFFNISYISLLRTQFSGLEATSNNYFFYVFLRFPCRIVHKCLSDLEKNVSQGFFHYWVWRYYMGNGVDGRNNGCWIGGGTENKNEWKWKA